jgi:hypothetical protein
MKMVVTGLVLTGVVAACSSQSAVSQGSVSSCVQFGVAAIRHHVTVTAVPAACQGLSQLELNVALDRALQAAAAGLRGKARRRQLIARDSLYLVGLIKAVPAPSQPAVAAPPSRPPSRAALSLAALVAWVITAGLGVSMMARWITRWIARTRRHGTQPGRGRAPALNLTHFGLALTGLLVWISYVATGVTALAWVGCGLLLAVASLGMALVFRAPAPSPVTSLAPAGPAARAPGTATAADRPGLTRRPGIYPPWPSPRTSPPPASPCCSARSLPSAPGKSLGMRTVTASRGMPSTVWIAKRARSRRTGSVCNSPSHSWHHRVRVAAGSSAATATSIRPDAERACRVRVSVACASVSSSASIMSMLSWAATGTKISSDSLAVRSCFACGMNCAVRWSGKGAGRNVLAWLA